MPRIVICDDCGQQAEHYAHGICKKCYMQTYRERPGKRKRHAEIDPDYYAIAEKRIAEAQMQLPLGL